MHPDTLALLKNSRFCALATEDQGQPYCSLMAYAAEDDGSRIYMATHRNTQKFRNLLANPRASLLIDTRNAPEPRALTLTGRFEEVSEARNRHRVRDLLLKRHPDMQEFVDHPKAALICVISEAAVFLKGLTDARYEIIG